LLEYQIEATPLALRTTLKIPRNNASIFSGWCVNGGVLP